MKVVVITDIRLYRDGVAEALSRLDDVETAVTAANGPAAVLTVRRTECDVALLDMAMADNTDAIALLHSARPALKVVALGVAEDGPEVVACAEAGVCGYVSRDASLVELADALRSAVRGEAPLSGRVAAGLLRHIALHADTRATNGSDRGFTPRERDVLRLVQSGMTNRQIARALDLQLSTVKNHVHNVLAKSGAARRTDVH